MDPATGRRWTQGAHFLSDLYIHKMVVPARTGVRYASAEDFLGPLRRRMADVEFWNFSEPLLSAATSDGGWQKIAALDAGISFAEIRP